VALALVFYMLLKPVRKDVALLAAFFGILATALFAVAELFYFAPSFILNGAGYLKTFRTDQLNSLAMLSLRFYAWGAGIFMALVLAPAYRSGWLLLLIIPGGLALMVWLGVQALKTKTPLDVPLS
jgi:hypothetical protein